MIYIGNVVHGNQVMESIDSVFSEVTMQVISREENSDLLAGGCFPQSCEGR